MKLRRSTVALLLGLLAVTPELSAQGASQGRQQTQQSRLPYEVVVTPTIKRSDIRKLIVQVEEDFFAKFNELNIDDEYDIYCYKYTPTMSHIPQRVCEPRFLMEARGINVSEVVYGMGTPGGSGGAAPTGVLLSPVAMKKKVAPQYEILEQKMESLNASDLELNSIGAALASLKARLEDYGKD